MKICQIGTGSLPVTPLVTGGVEKYIHYLCSSLQELGHEVTLIDIPCHDRSKTTYDIEEVPVVLKDHKNAATHIVSEFLFDYFSSLHIQRLAKTKKFDVINFQSQFSALFGMQMAQRMGIPSVFTLHNPIWSDTVCCRSLTQKLRFWMERTAEKKADLVICLSKTVAANVTRFLGVDPVKVLVVPVGIDDSWFIKPHLDPAIQYKYGPNNEPIILNVARIASYKNQLTIIKGIPDILKQVPNAQFIFVGPVESPSYLRMLKKNLTCIGSKNNVVFTGSISLSELRQLYYLADVFVFPSLKENMPQAMLEAMAAGRPIIFSSIAPLREVLPSDAGIMISASDHEALMMATIKLLQDRGLRDELGVKARSYAFDNYRWSSVAQQIIATYNRVSPVG